MLGAADVAEELEGDRAGGVRGAGIGRRRVEEVGGAVGFQPVGGAGVGGQRRRERVDDRVLVRVAAAGAGVAVVGVAALVAGDPVIGAGRRDGDRKSVV